MQFELTEEEKLAVERYRTYRAGEVIKDSTEFWRTVVCLAKAMLRLFPKDHDESIENCWVDVQKTEDFELALSASNRCVSLDIWLNGPFGGNNLSLDLPLIKTQDQFRQLCDLLGSPLPESSSPQEAS